MFSRAGSFTVVLVIFIAIFALLSNVLFLFPCYMSLTFDTYTLASAASKDNFLDYTLKDKLADKILDSGIVRNGYIDGRTVKIECFEMDEEGGTSLVRENTDNFNNFIENKALQRGQEFKVRISYDYVVKIKFGGFSREIKVPLDSTKICYSEKFYSVKLF